MPGAPLPDNEAARQRAVRSYSALNGERDAWTDELVQAASRMTGCPIALVSILDEQQQWFKGCVGLDVNGTPREQAFCGYTILGGGALVVEDARLDERFADNPLVTGDPGIRFYAGVPIRDDSGYAIGSLCVIDRSPRTISRDQLEGLESLASLVSRHVASAHRHDAIMGSALDAIITIDEQSRVIEFNEPASRIFGFTVEEAVGQSLAELIIPPPLREAHAAGMRHYLQTGEGPVLGKRIEITAIRKGGEEFPVELAISPWSVGGQRCFTAFIRDITESHELYAALRESEQRFRDIAEAAGEAIWETDVSGRYTYVSEQIDALLGLPPDEVLGTRLQDRLLPDDANRATAILSRASETDEPFRNVELQYRHASAGVRWLRLSGRCQRDSYGRIVGYRGMSLDVTEFKEAGLRRRRLMELQGIVRDVVAMFIDPSQFEDATSKLLAEIGDYFEADSAWVLTLESGEWVARQGWRRFVERDTDTPSRGVASTWPDAGSLSRDEVVLREVSCDRRSTTHLGIPVFVDGAPDRYLAFDGCRRPPKQFEDKQALLLSLAQSMAHAIERERRRRALVESAERLEEALARANEASAAKSAFLAHMSHELRTPLTAVLGFGRMLREGELHDERSRELLSKIDSNGQSLLNIINTILDLSKVEAGAIEARTQSIDVLDCVRRAADASSGSAAAKGLALSVTVASGVPESIQTDRVRLIQILTNLLGNAVKYTEVGSVTLSIRGGDGYLHFDVIDTGPGIPSDLQRQVFEPFDRGSARGETGGTGLGLAISRRLAALLGGDIRLVSTPGEGSTFTLALPLQGASGAELSEGDLVLTERAEASSSATQSDDSLAGVNILLVEDSEHVQEVMAYFLRERGAGVSVCSNGREAVDRLTSGGSDCDLILMDMQMPVLDGYNATRELRASGVKIPIVALTAHGMQHERDQCLAAGCDDYISKPVEPEFLAAVCLKLVRPSASTDASAGGLGAREPADGVDMLAQLSARFRLHLIEQADFFESELQSGSLDRDGVRSRAHRIAGAAGNLGFPDVTDAARLCEQAIRREEDDSAVVESVEALIRTIRVQTA